MMTGSLDLLSSSAALAQSAQAVLRGNELLTQLRNFPAAAGSMQALLDQLGDARLQDPDRFHAALLAFLHGRGRCAPDCLPRDVCQQLDLEANAAYTDVSAARAVLANYAKALPVEFIEDDASIVARLRQKFDFVEELGMNVGMDAIAGSDYYHCKINHGYWEQIATLAGARGDGRILRALAPARWVPFYETGFFSAALLNELRAVYAGARTAADGTLLLPDALHFAIGFTSGKRSIVDCLAEPGEVIVRGAMRSVLAYFDALMPGRRLQVHDGAAAKFLCYRNTLLKLVDDICAQNDALLFVVPKALRRLAINAGLSPRSRDRAQYVLPIPRFHVHALWPAVAASLIGTLDMLFERHARIAILTQSAVCSALLPLLLRDYRAHSDPRGLRRLHYYDLGRVLDLADPEALAKQKWSQQIDTGPDLLNPFICVSAAAGELS